MKLFLAIFCAFLTVSSFGAPTNDLELNSRIIGGLEAKPHSFPYIVGMMITVGEAKTWCGGSLISSEYVITAAHCVQPASEIRIFVGIHKLPNLHKPDEGSIFTDKNNFIVHPKYDSKLVENDIALIKLPKPIQMSDNVKTINLPRKSQVSDTFANEEVIGSGWGRTSDDKTKSVNSVLLYFRADVIRNRECSAFFPRSMVSSKLCVDGTKKKSACKGDSGGPLVHQEDNGNEILLGITSYVSKAGCTLRMPSVYTRVTHYLDWISENTGIEILN